MRRLFFSIPAIILASAAFAQVPMHNQMFPPGVNETDPRLASGFGRNSSPIVTYDAATHERITYSLDRETGGFIEGVNTESHKSWRANVHSDGSITGKDADGDRWKYDRRARLYTNLTTGKTCEQTSLRRVCAP